MKKRLWKFQICIIIRLGNHKIANFHFHEISTIYPILFSFFHWYLQMMRMRHSHYSTNSRRKASIFPLFLSKQKILCDCKKFVKNNFKKLQAKMYNLCWKLKLEIYLRYFEQHEKITNPLTENFEISPAARFRVLSSFINSISINSVVVGWHQWNANEHEKYF